MKRAAADRRPEWLSGIRWMPAQASRVGLAWACCPSGAANAGVAGRFREAAIPEHDDDRWWVYILRCRNGALYTGVTTDVARRVDEHQANARSAARYTRAFSPVALAYRCRIGSKRLAFQVEYRIKRLPREKKAALVAENPSRSALLAYLNITDVGRDHHRPPLNPRDESCG